MAEDEEPKRTLHPGAPSMSSSDGSIHSDGGSTTERPLPLPLPLSCGSKSFGVLSTQSCPVIQSPWIQRLKPLARTLDLNTRNQRVTSPVNVDAKPLRRLNHNSHVEHTQGRNAGTEIQSSDTQNEKSREKNAVRFRPSDPKHESIQGSNASSGFRSSDVKCDERVSGFLKLQSQPNSSMKICTSLSSQSRSHGSSMDHGVFVSKLPDSKRAPLRQFFQPGFDQTSSKAISPRFKEGPPCPSCSGVQMKDNYPLYPLFSESAFAPIQSSEEEPLSISKGNSAFIFKSSKMEISTYKGKAAQESSANPLNFKSSQMELDKYKGKNAQEIGNLMSIHNSLGSAPNGSRSREIDRSGASKSLTFVPFKQSVESNSTDTASTQSFPKELFVDLYLEACSQNALPKICKTCEIDKLGIKKLDPCLNDDATSIGVVTDNNLTTPQGSKSNTNILSIQSYDLINRHHCFVGEGLHREVQGAVPSSGVQNVPLSTDVTSFYDIHGSSSSSLLVSSQCNANGSMLQHSRDLNRQKNDGECTGGEKRLHLSVFNSQTLMAVKENYENSCQACSNKAENMKCRSDLEAGILNVAETSNLWMSRFKEKPLQKKSHLDGSDTKEPLQGSLKNVETEIVRSITGRAKGGYEIQRDGTQGDRFCSSSVMWLQHWHCPSLSAAQRQIKHCPEPKEALNGCKIEASMDSKSPDVFGYSRILGNEVTDHPSEKCQEKTHILAMKSPQNIGKATASKLWPYPEYGSSSQTDYNQPGNKSSSKQPSTTPSVEAMSMIGSARRQVWPYIFGGKHEGAKGGSQVEERQKPG